MEISIKSKIFDDNEMFFDCVNSQKHISQEYCNSAINCTDSDIKVELINLLNDELDINVDLFTEAKNRSLITSFSATQEEISKIKDEYTKK